MSEHPVAKARVRGDFFLFDFKEFPARLDAPGVTARQGWRDAIGAPGLSRRRSSRSASCSATDQEVSTARIIAYLQG
ncbi:hypothetical protein [Caulobacter sp. RL271]|jgi:hypothetical protein|uniref:Uncharacterized protein n=1 Tax=Caulobacter segnis TaxID=88688 RepID=A0ABY5A030_9CAUL|nr:hypothetical protein [Caulobacter segnis]USQ98430.1 hypothetical protein MZV50_13160 [Caulobacter segnis]